MTVNIIDPLNDPRWQEFVSQHPDATPFHSSAWMRALSECYGYECKALTTSMPGNPLEDALPFCEVSSWLTGSRLVSLPFADHCEPLSSEPDSLKTLIQALVTIGAKKPWKYAELRPARPLTHDDSTIPLHNHESYAFHILDLSPDVNTIIASFHKGQIQQKIRKAERNGIQIEGGQSDRLVEEFYTLQLKTRRRHKLPPQPRGWFQSLAKHFGNECRVWIARYEGKAVASVFTLESNSVVICKYVCSDSDFHNLGCIQAITWASIQHAKDRGARTFDFGRSDLDNKGLISYKDQWGTHNSPLHYYRDRITTKGSSSASSESGLAKKIFSRLPDPLLEAAGLLLYRHMG